jgi:hypothetical protein
MELLAFQDVMRSSKDVLSIQVGNIKMAATMQEKDM